jgi:hypothetical protein
MCTSLFFYKKIDDFSEKYANLINKTRYWGLFAQNNLQSYGGKGLIGAPFV